MAEQGGGPGTAPMRAGDAPDRFPEVDRAQTSTDAASAFPGVDGAVPMLPIGSRPRRRFRRSAPDPTDGQTDWRWVEEWRHGNEPTPWGPGLFLAGFAGLIIGCAVYVISAGLADNVLLAVAANIVVALGLTPALWMSRALPVLRWVALGGALGTVIAWISLIFFPLVP